LNISNQTQINLLFIL